MRLIPHLLLVSLILPLCPAPVSAEIITTHAAIAAEDRSAALARVNGFLAREDVRAHWLPYVRVADPKPLADRVDDLGGFVLLPPLDEIRQGTVAIVIDPSGAAVALQQWEES